MHDGGCVHGSEGADIAGFVATVSGVGWHTGSLTRPRKAYSSSTLHVRFRCAWGRLTMSSKTRCDANAIEAKGRIARERCIARQTSRREDGKVGEGSC
jgi:hypothetical protein